MYCLDFCIVFTTCLLDGRVQLQHCWLLFLSDERLGMLSHDPNID